MKCNKLIGTIDENVQRHSDLVNVPKSDISITYLLEFHDVSEPPPYCVGDKEYTGYLIISEDGFSIADYTWDKYGWCKEFHVDGEAETGVKYWAVLPKKNDISSYRLKL